MAEAEPGRGVRQQVPSKYGSFVFFAHQLWAFVFARKFLEVHVPAFLGLFFCFSGGGSSGASKSSVVLVTDLGNSTRYVRIIFLWGRAPEHRADAAGSWCRSCRGQRLKALESRVPLFDYRQIDLNQFLFGVHDPPLGLSLLEGSQKWNPASVWSLLAGEQIESQHSRESTHTHLQETSPRSSKLLYEALSQGVSPHEVNTHTHTHQALGLKRRYDTKVPRDLNQTGHPLTY